MTRIIPTIVSASTCAPLANAAVYIWLCDRLGRYSLYGSGVTNQNYLRGVQAADAATTQKTAALATQEVYQQALNTAGYGQITTEILPLKNYITAEEYHQNYLKKNPDGYCGLGGTGVKYQVPVVRQP